MRKIFVSDYDGTITHKDFYSLLAERYIPGDTPDYFAQYREGRITHFEAMAAYFAFAPTDEQQLEELLAASQADPDLGASAALLQRAGWELWIVSAGSSWYVERVLTGGSVWPRPYTRTRDAWRTDAGWYWRGWTPHPHIIRHQWAWTSRP